MKSNLGYLNSGHGRGDVVRLDTVDQHEYERMRILGIPISIVDLGRAADWVIAGGKQAKAKMVFVREAASLMAAVDEPRLRQLHDQADLVVADGTPLVWLGRAKGFGRKIGRVAGAELVDEVCARSVRDGLKHYFYGGKPGVAADLSRKLQEKYPGLEVAGSYSPPMRSIGPDFKLDQESLEELEMIRCSGPAIIWVGLSSPKQEYWMREASQVLGSGVFLGVGAAFDFHTGAIKRAPKWMRNNGLEWAHRLYSEPKRLWRRYLLLVPRFALASMSEEISRRIRLIFSGA